MNNKKPEILVLFGGRETRHILVIEEEFKKLKEPVVFSNYKRINFKTGGRTDKPKVFLGDLDLAQFKVIFFRGIGNRWEIANLITGYLQERIDRGEVKIIDPLVVTGDRYRAMKSYQMFAFAQAGLPVPKTLFGRLKFLEKEAGKFFGYPFILKRSEGARGERVYLVNDQKEMKKLAQELLPQETEERKTFLAQEFIANKGDLRVLVMGDKILGAMKRARTRTDEFRNNVSLGGKAEEFKLTPELEVMALKAAYLAKLTLAGVDIVLRHPDQQPFIFEVNRAPQFKGFVKATGVNVPRKIAEYLISLKKEVN